MKTEHKKAIQQPDGSWRYPLEPSKLRRKTDWDYRQPGTYAITLVLADRSRGWLGQVAAGAAAPAAARAGAARAGAASAGELARPSSEAVAGELARPSSEPVAGERPTPEQARAHERRAHVRLTPLGEAVLRLWRALAAMWPGVEPREAQVMPEHFHGILRIARPQRHPLGQIIGSFKAKVTAAVRELVGGGVLVPPGVIVGSGLFAPGFHDAILWKIRRYRQERDYILSNPDRLLVKREHPDLFKVVRDIAVPLPGRDGAIGHFMAIGNHFLLQRPLFQVQCSRRFFGYRRNAPVGGARPEIVRDAAGNPIAAFASPEYEARRAAAVEAANNGRVLLSPCVSEGERQIAREALLAQRPLVVMQNKGFARLQKPSGHYFEACAAGRLLLLAPIAWPYQPGHKPMTRLDATAMNRLCQWLAGDDAAEINYHGQRPTDIDALAVAAARAGAARAGELARPSSEAVVGEGLAPAARAPARAPAARAPELARASIEGVPGEGVALVDRAPAASAGELARPSVDGVPGEGVALRRGKTGEQARPHERGAGQ